MRGADLLGADLRYSDLRGADLRYSDLLGVDLRHANLLGADLRDANLRDADLIVLQMDLWTAYITTNHIRIGCQSSYIKRVGEFYRRRDIRNASRSA
jgi:hypothetical protein